MPNNETIERIAEKYVYCCESKEKHELAYCAPCGETKNVELAIVAALSEMRTIALREAAEMQCRYCAGAIDDAVVEPKFFPEGYVPNFGRIEDTFLHETTWGGLYQCDAEKIHLAQRAAADGEN